MNKKILVAGIAVTAIALAGGVYAASQSGVTAQAQVKTQVQAQTANQGEETNVQTMTEERIQSGDAVNQAAPKAVAPVQTQVQQKLQDGSGAGSQVKAQVQTVNQGANAQNQAGNNAQVQAGNAAQSGTSSAVQARQQAQQKLQDGSGTSTQAQNQSGSAIAQQRRSQVASAVQTMLQISERNGGIGQQIKTIAQAQTQNQEKIETSLAKVQNRGALAKFFFGPNYGEINNAEKTLEQNREQIKQLNQVKNLLANQGDQQQLTEQINLLERANLEIGESLAKAQEGASLFGWLNRLFVK
ncbi:MAG: hypothetical protein WC719_03530 [Patescibacteria group bacterium]|jgi:hypothetical protein